MAFPTRNYAVKNQNIAGWVLQDHDDISLPRRIEVQMNYIKEHPALVAVLTMFQLFKDKPVMELLQSFS